MVYITVKQPPSYHQISLEEFLFSDSVKAGLISANETNTRTYVTERPNEKLRSVLDVDRLIGLLRGFNERTAYLREKNAHELYRTFYIPKSSGGLRRIDAPCDELMEELRYMKMLFETEFHALYHTSAFAYIHGRCTIDAVKRHQANESRWFAKLDLSNFFGSTTPAFVMKQLSMIYPFSEVIRREAGRIELETAISLAFLDGVLPQGTPISPLITNIMMIPIDHALANTLRNFNRESFVYTRYADDFIISCRYDFDVKSVLALVRKTLKDFGAPFSLNERKTKYVSSSGKNYILGAMLNQDNQITVGYQNKKRLKAMLTSYVLDRKNGIRWEYSDVMAMEGLRNYYHMVEGKVIDDLVSRIGEKYGVNIRKMIHDDVAGLPA